MVDNSTMNKKIIEDLIRYFSLLRAKKCKNALFVIQDFSNIMLYDLCEKILNLRRFRFKTYNEKFKMID